MRTVLALLLVASGPAAAQVALADAGALPPEAAAGPVVYAFGGTGLRVTLPAGWDGLASADESRLPGYALYALANTAAGSGLADATLRIERVVGLTPLDAQRWRTGAVPYGYHGTRPVGPIALPLPGLGLEVAGAAEAGAVAFAQRGTVYWTVQIVGPPALWASRRADLLAVLAGVALP